MRVFFLLFLYYFFYYFVLPVCCFVPEFLFFPPTGALVTERAPAARGVRSQGWHHNERQRAAVPQDLHPPLRASQVRDSLKLEGGLLKRHHWHSLRFSIFFPTVFCGGTKLLNILNSNWWRIFLKWKWRRINNYMWSRVFYRYNDPRG